MQERNVRSLQCRWRVITKEVGNFRGCVRQVESFNMMRSKETYMQLKDCSKGFKLDHVWHLLKNEEKYTRTPNFQPRFINVSIDEDSYSPMPETSTSFNLSYFSLNLSKEGMSGSSSR